MRGQKGRGVPKHPTDATAQCMRAERMSAAAGAGAALSKRRRQAAENSKNNSRVLTILRDTNEIVIYLEGGFSVDLFTHAAVATARNLMSPLQNDESVQSRVTLQCSNARVYTGPEPTAGAGSVGLPHVLALS